MGALTPRVTKQRVLGGLTFFLVAAGIMYLLGAEMPSLLLGAVVGIALVGGLAALLWALDRGDTKSSLDSERSSPGGP